MTAEHTLSLIARGASEGGYLLVIENGSSLVYPLPTTGSIVIGRSPEATLRLTDNACSRKHATVIGVAGELLLEDLGSHNGTKLNGRRVSGTQIVTSGDVVTIGEVVIIVHVGPKELVRSAVMELSAFRQRVADEVDRAIRYDRSLAVIAVALGGPVPGFELPASELVQGAALTPDHHLFALLPEVDTETACDEARRLVEIVDRARGESETRPRPRAGVAACPLDGSRADLLLGSARAAAAAAPEGGVLAVGDAKTTIELGERVLLVADPAMVQLFQLLRRLAPSELPVLVTGETGAGKENTAHALHRWSPRASGPLVPINCAALQESLAEGELFGHEKGAFTGADRAKTGLLEAASGGTVFFDEVGELSLAIQAKLLRALENRTIMRVGATRETQIDIRIVAATNRDLDAEVKAGRFRQDLYFRLGGAHVALPPLRDRPREIALLANSFLEEGRVAAKRPPLTLSAAAMNTLLGHAWPGNVRELKNEMQYLVATVDDSVVEPWHLSERFQAPVAVSDSPSGPTSDGTFRPIAEELRELERQRMSEALDRAGGMQKKAAEAIRMPLRTFRMKSKQYGLDRKPRGP